MDVGVVLVEMLLSQSVTKRGYSFSSAFCVPVCPPDSFGTGGFLMNPPRLSTMRTTAGL